MLEVVRSFQVIQSFRSLIISILPFLNALSFDSIMIFHAPWFFFWDCNIFIHQFCTAILYYNFYIAILYCILYHLIYRDIHIVVKNCCPVSSCPFCQLRKWSYKFFYCIKARCIIVLISKNVYFATKKWGLSEPEMDPKSGFSSFIKNRRMEFFWFFFHETTAT